ncbi:MAG: MBL fold metallo-hydrolase [Clostridia bacterium]|nr:MBL fold metallo-hydrolase [Clostridia bacterium]
MKHTGGDLFQLTERIWVYPFEELRDRPNLGYIRGDKWSLAVDAGHSAEHIAEFYAALEKNGLPLPQLTVLTHWHWDHTFAMHAVHGLCLANAQTNAYIRDIREKIAREGPESFLAFHESIRREYEDGKPVIVTLADLVFTGKMELDTGNCPIRIFQAEAPHTDDSTLIHVPSESVLFIGDAEGGAFPHWKKDMGLARKLADTVRKTGATVCVEGHWKPVPTEDTINAIMEEEG